MLRRNSHRGSPRERLRGSQCACSGLTRRVTRDVGATSTSVARAGPTPAFVRARAYAGVAAYVLRKRSVARLAGPSRDFCWFVIRAVSTPAIELGKARDSARPGPPRSFMIRTRAAHTRLANLLSWPPGHVTLQGHLDGEVTRYRCQSRGVGGWYWPSRIISYARG